MDNQKKTQNMPSVPKGILILGSFLIFIGSYVAYYVIREVLNIYLNWGENPFIALLTEQFKNTELFAFSDSPFVVTDQGGVIIAFILFIMLALLGIKIAVSFIRAGAHIISPAVPYQLERLKLRIDRLNDRVKEHT